MVAGNIAVEKRLPSPAAAPHCLLRKLKLGSLLKAEEGEAGDKFYCPLK